MHSEFYKIVRKEKKIQMKQCLLEQSKGKSSAPGTVSVYEWQLGYAWQ